VDIAGDITCPGDVRRVPQPPLDRRSDIAGDITFQTMSCQGLQMQK
jgi:hypothetical protein